MHPVNKNKMIMEDLNISSVLFYPRDWSFSCHRIWRGPMIKLYGYPLISFVIITIIPKNDISDI